ncbi:MAG: DNA translocase FtsK 4TM domain-containing protein [Acidobacteriota bacterium]|nr:DNA translocase FtsK 4TM domain-containing protein [Acidobacteriota bacterium]
MNVRDLITSARGREATGILLTGMAVLLAVSLASYSPLDPSFFTSSGERPANWVGPAGAQIAALCYESFGLAAWFFPMTLLAAALRRLAAGDDPVRRSAALGLAVVGVSTALLLALIVGRIGYLGAPLLAGGLFGKLLADGLVALFSDVGSVLIAGTLMLVGLALAARSSLAEATESAVASARDAWPGIGRGARQGASHALALLRSGLVWDRSIRTRGASGWIPRPRPGRTGDSAPPPEPAPKMEAKPVVATTDDAAVTRSIRPRRAKRRPSPGGQANLPVEMHGAGGRPPLPPVELLSAAPPGEPVSRRDLLETARLIESRCAEFSVEGRVLEIHPGPVVTTFEFRPDAGIKLSRITALADDLALALEAESVRIDRIPGRPAVGIEVPNRIRELIAFREVVESDVFQRSKDLLTLGLGKTQEGEVFCASLAKMPHVLVAGSTGSGKSVGLNGIITSILYRARPNEVKFILIDPKMLELGIYEGLPHLLVPVVTDMSLAVNALRWAVREMERRYKLLAACNVRHLDGYNRLLEKDRPIVEQAIENIPRRRPNEKYDLERVPHIVIVVDELADLMMATGQETTEAIARLAQKARAAGLHLVLATQRPSVDILTGVIKANFPARIAYRVSSKIDSRTILDASGGERLLGAGDMLYRQPSSSRLIRLHGAFLTEEESMRVVAWLKQQARACYDRSVLEEPQDDAEEGGGVVLSEDPMFEQAARLVISTGQASTSFLQRRMRLGYSRAARIVDEMEEAGIVGPADGSRPRTVLVGPEFLERLDQIAEDDA